MKKTIYKKRFEIYVEAIPDILTLFSSHKYTSLPGALRKMEIHKVIAKTLFISTPETEEMLINYMNKLFEYISILSNEEEAQEKHAETSKIASELYIQMKKEVSINE